MKRLSSILVAIILSLPLWGQDMARLSYAEEVTVPGAQAWQLYEKARKWYKVAKEPLNILMATYSGPDHILNCEVDFWDYQPENSLHTYDILFHVYVSCQEGGYVVELTDIIGRVDGNTLSGYEYTEYHWDYMTQDRSGVRGGIYKWYWRKHDKRVRQWLEDYFRQMSDSLYEAMTAS